MATRPDHAPRSLFRISSLEPMDCSREIVDLVAAGGCFAPHLPFASSARERSRPDRRCGGRTRSSTTRRLSTTSGGACRTRPSARTSSSGFPGETDEDFEELAWYLDGSPLTHVHVFPYSDRPGTDATMMRGKVDGAVVRERGRRVRDIAQRLSQRFRESQVGTIRPALTIDDGTSVVTDNYLKLRVPPGCARNECVRVRISRATKANCFSGPHQASAEPIDVSCRSASSESGR